MNKIKITLYLFVLAAFIVSGCRDNDKNNNDSTTPTADTNPDDQGNLYVSNQLGEAIFIFRQGKVLKEIPANTDQFLINIPNEGLAVELKVWKKSDVKTLGEQSEDLLFRKWVVVLSTGTSEAERAAWIIKEGSDVTASGTLTFEYPTHAPNGSQNLYSVDVFLNNKNGAKIVSLAPGGTRKVGIEYGYHIIYYRFWFSDPNGTTGISEIGWIEKDEAGKTISAVINAGNPSSDYEIPVFKNSDVGRSAKIEIINNYDDDLQIYANSTPIENIAIENNSTQGLSYIQAGGSYIFTIPQGDYRLEAKNVSSAETVEETNIYAVELYKAKWEINSGVTLRKVSIINNSNEKISIHNAYDDQYLGSLILANETKEINIADTITQLRVFAESGAFAITSDTAVTSWTIETPVDGLGVTTGDISKKSTYIIDVAGEISGIGNGVLQHGHCWSSTDFAPTIKDSKSEFGEKTETGTFSSTIENLKVGQTYYVRAYAYNNDMIVYGAIETYQIQINAEPFSDGFESYSDFTLSPGNWVMVDLDTSATFGIAENDFPNESYTGSFIVFNPSATSPPSSWTAHTGNKCLACFSAEYAQNNNDWLISPAVVVGNDYQVSFYAKSADRNYEYDRFRVGVSTGGTNPKEFNIISSGAYVTTSINWTKYTYDLSAYANKEIRVAINCVSSNAWFLLVDDFMIGQKATVKKYNEIVEGQTNQTPAINATRASSQK